MFSRRTLWSLASACVRGLNSPNGPGCPWIAALSSTPISKPARLEFSRRAISRAGRIRAVGEAIRVEHWVVAERQGQVAALNMLGRRKKFAAVPFFWSQHYDIPINYVGHAEKWDELAIEGDIAGKDCSVRFKRQGRTLAVASIFRDVESLQAELTMERAAAAQRQ